jgi:hypothetical protein
MARMRLRLAGAVLIVVAGFAALTPSMAVDSDGDGVADSVEIYELGTDPSQPNTFGRPIVVERPSKS